MEFIALSCLVTRKIPKRANISKRTDRQLGILRVVRSCLFLFYYCLFLIASSTHASILFFISLLASVDDGDLHGIDLIFPLLSLNVNWSNGFVPFEQVPVF